jgi:hypothetical protein
VSDRALWLDEWCPTCRAAPDARCRVPWGRRATAKPSALHIARGWRARPCPKCKAIADEPCRTPPGRDASLAHEARLRPGLYELRARDDVSAELERRGATIATVPLAAAPAVDRIVLGRVRANELVDVERWSGADELCHALEAPIWDRFGSFPGQPQIAGVVLWSAADRCVVPAMSTSRSLGETRRHSAGCASGDPAVTC